MSRGWQFNSGDWNAVCDSCGQKLKASQLRRRWDGMMVCDADFEIRHPMDFIKVRQDKISVPWSRPQLPVVFPPLSEFISESIGPIAETIDISQGLYRYVGIINAGIYDADVVNGSTINFGALNATSVDPPSPASAETAVLTEAIITYLSVTQDISDAVTVSETVVEGESEIPTDTLAYSEIVTATIVTNKVLNGSQLNGAILG